MFATKREEGSAMTSQKNEIYSKKNNLKLISFEKVLKLILKYMEESFRAEKFIFRTKKCKNIVKIVSFSFSQNCFF